MPAAKKKAEDKKADTTAKVTKIEPTIILAMSPKATGVVRDALSDYLDAIQELDPEMRASEKAQESISLAEMMLSEVDSQMPRKGAQTGS